MKQQAMKKQSGFTLIELVIVIIILGILAATAVPKFIDMQGDARKAAMNGVKAALESAATLTYSKVAIDGKEKNTEAQNKTATYDVDGVKVAFGYPVATKDALEKVAGLADTEWTITDVADKDAVTIVAKGDSSGCKLTYTQAAAKNSRPKIEVSGCDGTTEEKKD